MLVPLLKNDLTAEQQYNKVTSEVVEVNYAMKNESKEKQLHECVDVIISTFNLMDKISENDTNILSAYEEVLIKLESRGVIRGRMFI